jgi:ubiquinone/menaquinone biosynthesis C-methylase UbiE
MAARLRHPEAEFVILDLESEPPFADASFDLVTCSFGFNHIADPLVSLQRLRRLLRLGGSIGFTSWRQQSSAAPLVKCYLEALEDATGHETTDWGPEFDDMIAGALKRLRTPTGLRRLMREAGFADLRVKAENCRFSFASPRSFVEYQLAWGQDAEIAAGLGNDASDLITEALERRVDGSTPLSWDRTYYVTVGRHEG